MLSLIYEDFYLCFTQACEISLVGTLYSVFILICTGSVLCTGCTGHLKGPGGADNEACSVCHEEGYAEGALLVMTCQKVMVGGRFCGCRLGMQVGCALPAYLDLPASHALLVCRRALPCWPRDLCQGALSLPGTLL